MSTPTQRRVARALHAGGPEVIEVDVEDLPPLKAGEALVEVAAAGLNHAETLIRRGNYAVRLPFPHAVGGEGAGTVIATGPEVTTPVALAFAGARCSDRAPPTSSRRLSY